MWAIIGGAVQSVGACSHQWLRPGSEYAIGGILNLGVRNLVGGACGEDTLKCFGRLLPCDFVLLHESGGTYRHSKGRQYGYQTNREDHDGNHHFQERESLLPRSFLGYCSIHVATPD